jgi:magnesium transporter
MRAKFQKRSKKAGFSPGSLIHIGNRYAEKSKITLIRYDETFYWEKHLDTLADINNVSLFQKKEVALAVVKLLH